VAYSSAKPRRSGRVWSAGARGGAFMSGSLSARCLTGGSAGAAAGGRVVFGGDACGGFFAEADVVPEAGQVLVAGFGLQLGCGASGLGKVLERRDKMPELVLTGAPPQSRRGRRGR
jgi:hypothetical protein